MCVPKNDLLFIDSNARTIGVSICVFAFAVCQLFSSSKKVKIYSVDIWWCILIVYTGLSTLWATNAGFAIYGIFTTLLLFACYKSFENIDFESATIKNCIYWGTMICLLVALTVEFLSVSESVLSFAVEEDKDSSIQEMIGKSLHIIGSSIVLLLPFAIFNEKKSTKIIAPILLLASLVIVYFSGSAQATILICFLCVIYILYSIPYKRSIKYLVLIGFMGIIAAALYTASTSPKGSYVVNEFYQQNDRLLMWKNSLNLFSESPIIGHGKNNWSIEYGKYGYNGYDTFTSDVFDFERFVHPHNSFISIISEGGLISICIYVYLFVLPCLRIFNERKLLSKLEIASICTLCMFLFLSLIYGSIYNFYDNFQGLNIIAIFGLAALSHTSNKSVYIGQMSSKLGSALIILATVPCLFYFYSHTQTSCFFESYSQNHPAQKNISKENELLEKYLLRSYTLHSDQAITLAKNSYNRAKVSRSIDVLEKALENDPYHVELLTVLAKIKLENGNHKEAKKLANQGHLLRRNLIDPQLLLAKSEFLLQKDSKSANKICTLKNKLKKRSKANQKINQNKDLASKSKELRFYSKKIKELDSFINIQKITDYKQKGVSR